MTYNDFTNAELIGFVEAKKHYLLDLGQLKQFNAILDARLAELRYA